MTTVSTSEQGSLGLFELIPKPSTSLPTLGVLVFFSVLGSLLHLDDELPYFEIMLVLYAMLFLVLLVLSFEKPLDLKQLLAKITFSIFACALGAFISFLPHV